MQKRTEFAKKYLTGNGIEIGALHVPTSVPEWVKVIYVDRDPETVARNHGDVVPQVKDWVVDDAEVLGKFELESLDFIMAHHVLEHLEDPLLALDTWFRRLRVNGLLIFSLPNKDHTFDRNRPVTQFAHIMADYYGEKHRSRFEHMLDWYANAEQEGKKGHELLKAALDATDSDTNIHFHVWDFKAMREMLANLKFLPAMPDFDVHEAVEDGSECTFVIRKTTESA